MGTKSDKDKIARSPTPPETEDEGDDIEWPVHGIVGEDVDVFGISRFVTIKRLSMPTKNPRVVLKQSLFFFFFFFSLLLSYEASPIRDPKPVSDWVFLTLTTPFSLSKIKIK